MQSRDKYQDEYISKNQHLSEMSSYNIRTPNPHHWQKSAVNTPSQELSEYNQPIALENGLLKTHVFGHDSYMNGTPEMKYRMDRTDAFQTTSKKL